MSDTAAVYRCIAKVSGELSKAGIRKNRRNEQQHYAFRGIDDVYNALAPALSNAGLVILPRCLSRDVVERKTAKGSILFYVTVDVEFDFVAAEDGSKHTVRMPGEAMDSGDKATNKAMSAAYKYAAMQTFCIPTEGDNDADATTHEAIVAEAPEGYDDFLDDLLATADNGLDVYMAAWKASAEPFRAYALAHDKDKLTAAKKRATAVDERKAVPA